MSLPVLHRRLPAVAVLGVLTLTIISPVPGAAAAPIGVPPGGGSGYVRAFGNGEGGATTIPELVKGHRMRAVAAGTAFSLALGVNGKVYAWGQNSSGDTRVPANLDGLKVTAIAAGGTHALALTSTGKVVAWGEDDHGESTVPARVKKQKIVQIAAGHHHSLALTSAGKVLGWGDDSFHQTTVPASLKGKKVVSIAGGSLHSLAATADGSVVAWGSDWKGETEVPAALQGQKVIQVSAGRLDSLALTDTGHVIPWGYNEDGQEEGVPAGGVVGIASGEFHHVAVGADGTFYGWGQGHDGEVSDPYPSEPTRAVAGGFDHTLTLVDPTEGGFFADDPPARAYAGARYLYAFAAFGNPAPTFSVASGALPPGLKLSKDGILSGVPTQAGDYRFVVAARNGGNPDAVSRERFITILPGPAHVVIVSGDRQSAPVDQPFADPLVLKVVDDSGHPLDRDVVLAVRGSTPGAPYVTFADGTSTAAGHTDADGRFQSSVVLASNRPGVVTVDVTLPGDDATGKFRLAIDADASPVADLRTDLVAPTKAKTHHTIPVRVTSGNAGPSTADFVTSKLTWPAGWRLKDAAGGTVSGRTVTWNADTVTSGAEATHLARLVTARSRGTDRLRATTTSTTPDPSTSNDATTAEVKLKP